MTSGRCAACRYLRRKCPSDCIFSPYFPPTNPQRFSTVHRIYGASNVAKMLKQVPQHVRGEAADSMHFEAKCRIEEPVYGCVGIISQLQEQIYNVEAQLKEIQTVSILINPSLQVSGQMQTSSNPLFGFSGTHAHSWRSM